ncbi:Lipoma-preferred partner-like [Exaiptasia diaphana]|nr:Lipoma-preferred partner-like [Exaiptasia diaphana]
MSNPNNHVRSPQGKKIPPPVAPKPMKMTATRLMHKPVAVPPPPSSNDRTTEEDELDALTDLLVKNLEYSSDPDFFGICHKCGQKVSGEGSGCNAMDKLFHINCFVCHKCGCQLTGKVFYKVEDKAYCEADYLSSLEICWVCNKQITDRILRATGKCFHPHCFLCEECGKNLDGIPFTLDNFNKGQDETVRIVSMNKDFHVKCFKCEDCRCQLSSEKGGSGCYPLDDHLYCQECNAKHIQQLTADLDKPQRPLTTEL